MDRVKMPVTFGFLGHPSIIGREGDRVAEKSMLGVLEVAVAGRPCQVASVIAGATSPAPVRANMAATSAWDLTEEEFATADRLTGGA